MEVITHLQLIRDMLKSKIPVNKAVEVVASSEIFDMSNVGTIKKEWSAVIGLTGEEKENEISVQSPVITGEELTLPFPNVLIRTGERETKLGKHTFIMENYVFISEVNPYEYIGILYCPVTSVNTGEGEGVGNLFTIKDEVLTINGIKDETKEEQTNAIEIILKALHIISNLPKQQVHSYTPKKAKPEYWRRKGASTIKIVNRPIYYVINKEDEPSKIRVDHNKGYLKCEYSFRVRGHWRTLHNPKTIGLDRNGNRIIKGYTWIKEYMKGEGELIKRVRVVK